MQTELHLLLKPSSSDWDHWQELVKESNHPSAFADVFFLKIMPTQRRVLLWFW
jgi:hypothetical protein